MGKVLLVLGIIGILLGGAAAIISLILPQLTRNVSMSEKRQSELLRARLGL